MSGPKVDVLAAMDAEIVDLAGLSCSDEWGEFELRMRETSMRKARDGVADLISALKWLTDRNVTYWDEAGEVRFSFGSQQKAMEAFRFARAAISAATGETK